MLDWYKCNHEWKEQVDSKFSSELEADVYCIKCGCPGAEDRRTGDVFWPAI